MNKKKEVEIDNTQVAELTADLQRLRADFENYRKNIDREKALLMDASARRTLINFLPALDDIERATAHVPDSLAEDPWAQGVTSINKRLETTLASLGVKKIESKPGTKFDPNLHEAVQSGENGEKIVAELRTGYTLNGEVIRPTMVNVD
ncbi:nucleotide exchange factor GrpE [Candidatus Saccharibacteria bacterium]|nr:nucleotide exchange factor GrpE [Candidatus Saccharibacteria bacterium]